MPGTDRNNQSPRAPRDPFWDWIAVALWFILGAVVGGAIGVRVALRHGRSDRAHLLGLAIGAVAGGLVSVWMGWRESRRRWTG